MKTPALLLVLLLLCLAASVPAQQLELNDPGGALTRNGDDPVVGTPFVVSSVGMLEIDLSGAPSAGVILVAGDLAPVSTPIPGTEYFDLDLGGPLLLIVDGINGGGALFPFFTLGATNPGGDFSLAFSMSPANLNQTYGFQAVVADAAAPFGLNFTAAAAYLVSATQTLATFGAIADDAVVVALPTPFELYGQTVTEMTVSTKGVVTFDGSGVIDYTPTVGEFESGVLNGFAGPTAAAPVVAAFWEDIEAVNGSITVVATTSGYEIAWNGVNGFANGPTVGSFAVTIDYAPIVQIVIDHAQVTAAPTAFAPFVGISAGELGAAVEVHQLDLVAGGATGVFFPTMPLKQTLYQGFGTTAPVEDVDTQGLVLTFTDGSASGEDGQFFLF